MGAVRDGVVSGILKPNVNMKGSRTVLGAALSLLAAECASAAHFPRAVSGKGFLSVPIGTVDRPKKHTKRSSEPFVMQLDNQDFFYSADVEIGNPGQTVTVLVDTGSSELWVNPDCSTAPSQDQYEQCVDFGQYDPSKSSDASGPHGGEQLNYGDPSDASTLTSVEISYYRDDLTFGDAKITNQTFGIVTSSEDISQGIMGLAPDLYTGFDGGDDPYSLVLNTMYTQGVITSRIFALDLRHAESSTGAVIYGGIDKSKFIGTLEERPLARGIQGEYRLGANLTSIGVTSDNETEATTRKLGEDDRNVMLDSGTTLSRMHSYAAAPILQALGAEDDGEGGFVTLCSRREDAGSVDFTFGNKTIRVPFRDFIIDFGLPSYCYVGLVITTDQQILGDSVLRAGYFVFDWDNEAVHIGQAADCGDSDLVAVGSGADAVPNVTGNCKESDAVFTGGPVPSSTSSSGSSTNGDGSSGDGSDDAGVRGEVMMGMVIGFGVLAGAFNIW